MKKKILLLMGVFSLGLLQAQVGVNTRNPLGVLHVDPQANTAGTVASPTNASDDVIVTANGRVGIGTVDPQAKVHLISGGTVADPKPALRLEDGNQLDGRFLMTDANGLATWSDLIDPAEAILFAKGLSNHIPLNQTGYTYTNARITLPPGRWVVMVVYYALLDSGIATVVHRDIAINLSVTFSENTTSGTMTQVVSPDVEGEPLISAYVRGANIMFGSVVINNTSSGSKTYYSMAGGVVLYKPAYENGFIVRNFGGQWGEDNVAAFRIPSDL